MAKGNEMAAKKKMQFGGLPPRYGFMLNPYPDERISRCPLCEQKNRQRKLPLLIHVAPHTMIALNYTCRFCPACDLLIANKHHIEGMLTEVFRRNNPSALGNDYLIIGTVEKSVWRESMKQPKAVAEMLPYASDFAKYYDELRLTQPGWFHVSQEPPIMEPPPSQEWVKARSIFHRS